MHVLEIARGVVPEDRSERPYLDLSVYLNEDGTFSGDVVLASGARRIPQDCCVRQPARFFAIPEKLREKTEYFRATEHPNEVVITLRDSQFHLCCCFFKSQLEPDSSLRNAMDELISHIAQITDPRYKPKPLTAAEKRAVDLNRKFALHEAALSCDIGLIDKIVKIHPEQLEVENGNGFTPLEQAVWLGSSTALKQLIKHGADVNVKDASGGTPLHFACHAGDLEKVSLLVDSGADINASTNDGDRPIHFAIMANRKAIFRYLIGKGATFHKEDEATREAVRIGKKWKGRI
jgi:ankyrin repeat protein